MTLSFLHAAACVALLAVAFPNAAFGQNGTLVDNSTSCDEFAFRTTFNSTYDICQCDADFTGNGTHCDLFAQLDCSNSPQDSGFAFKVFLNQTYIDFYYDWTKLRLLNDSCNNVTLEGGYYILSSPEYDECGSVQSNNSDNIIYSNAVLSNGGGISTGAILNLPFTCFVAAFLNVSLTDDNDTAVKILVDQAAGDSRIVFPVQQGTGTVAATLYLYKDEDYATVFNGVPILSTADMLYVKISLETVLNGVYVISKECWATPDAAGTSPERFNIIQSPGCLENSVTNGKLTRNGVSEESRFQLQVFKFIPSDVVYLHCMVQLCTPTASRSCKPTCPSRRRKRAINVEARLLSSSLIIRSSHSMPQPPTHSDPAGNNEESDVTIHLLLPLLLSLVAVLIVAVVALIVYICLKGRTKSQKVFHLT